jgi:hypothetical protein
MKILLLIIKYLNDETNQMFYYKSLISFIGI